MPDRRRSRLQQMSGSQHVPVENRVGRLREARGYEKGAGFREVPDRRKAGQVTAFDKGREERVTRGMQSPTACSLRERYALLHLHGRGVVKAMARPLRLEFLRSPVSSLGARK